MVLPKVRTIYGLNSISHQAAATWNYFVNELPKVNFSNVSKAICKKYNAISHRSICIIFLKKNELICKKKSIIRKLRYVYIVTNITLSCPPKKSFICSTAKKNKTKKTLVRVLTRAV